MLSTGLPQGRGRPLLTMPSSSVAVFTLMEGAGVVPGGYCAVVATTSPGNQASSRPHQKACTTYHGAIFLLR